MTVALSEIVSKGLKPSAPIIIQKVKIAADDSYPTGGYDISSAVKGTLLGGNVSVLSDGHVAVVDRANKKVKIGKLADTTEVWTELSNGTDLSGVTGEIVLFCY